MSGKFQNINFKLDKFPAMPVVAAQIIKLINSPEASASKLAEVVAKDSAMSAHVLKIANSSYYSMSRQVTTLSKAIVILGERALKNLVLAASLRCMQQSIGSVEQMLWEDSMVCALGSRFLADKLSLVDPEEAFMAGLFCHIGKIVISNQNEVTEEFVVDMAAADNREMAEREKDILGSTHAEIGAAVLEQWKLSESMSLVALHHSDVDLTGIDDQNTIKMICLVNIANKFPAVFGIFGQREEIDLAELPGARFLNLEPDEITEVFEGFSSVFEENREDFLS